MDFINEFDSYVDWFVNVTVSKVKLNLISCFINPYCCSTDVSPNFLEWIPVSNKRKDVPLGGKIVWSCQDHIPFHIETVK